MRSIPRTSTLLILLACGAGCQGTSPTPEPGRDLDAGEACRRVVTRLAGVDSFSAEIGITFTLDGEERSASGALVVARPDRVRMRCWGPLGVTVMDLLVADGRATLHLPQDGRALAVDLGEPRASENIPRQVRALMLIDTLLDELRTADREWRPGVDSVVSVVELLDAGTPVARILFDRATLQPILREDLVLGTQVAYADYREGEHRWWPGTIRVTEAGITVAVEVDEVVENPDLDPAVFEMELPDGTVVERP